MASKKTSHSVGFEDDDSSVASGGISTSSGAGLSMNSGSGFSLQSLTSSMARDNKAVLSKPTSLSVSGTSAKLENERFLRRKHLEKRARKLKSRIEDRPTDQRALTEYSEVLYEQQNYILAQKMIRRLLELGDNSGYWHLKLGKCCYRRWLVYRTSYDLQNGVAAYKEAMKDLTIQKNKIHYFEVATMYLRLGRHQGFVDLMSTFMGLFQTDIEWVAIAQYNLSLILFVCGKIKEAMELLRDLNLSPLLIKVDRGEDHVSCLPYQIDNIGIELEIATIRDSTGEKKLARNLLFELWQQVEKYRKHGNTMQFDLHLGSPTFKEWYNDHNTFIKLGNMYRDGNNPVMAAEMYRMAVERSLKLNSLMELFQFEEEEWSAIPLELQNTILDLVIQRAELMKTVGSVLAAERCARFVFSKRPSDFVLTGRAANCCRPNIAANKDLVRTANSVEKAILKMQANARVRVAKADKRKRQFAVKAETIVTSFLKMLLVRNRLAERRLSSCPATHINALVDSLVNGRIGIMKSGREAVEMWVEIWYYAAVTVQTACKKWLCRVKYNRFFKGVRGLERVFRGQLTRTRLRKYVLGLQEYLDENPTLDSRTQKYRQERRRMSINIEIVNRICCGTTCISSEEYILGTTSLNSVGSPLRMKSRTERKSKAGPSSMLPPHRKPMWEKVEWFGEIAKRSTGDDGSATMAEGSTISAKHMRLGSRSQSSFLTPALDTSSSSYSSRPITAKAIQDYAESNPDEDVISFVSYLSVKSDVTKQWVPFGILPDREIERSLQCTVLVVTSPSFSVQDSKRFCTVGKSSSDSWSRIRSLFIYGTRMGPSGLKNFVDLGLGQMKSITFGQTKLTHHFGKYIGSQLMDVHPTSLDPRSHNLPQTVPSSVSLQKIYIEQEPFFGDRGVESLLKCLQFNTSVRILGLRDCSITNRGAAACARYIGMSNSIELINLGENLLSRDVYLSIIRSVATRGGRGKLRQVSLKEQTPGMASREQLFDLYHMGNELGLKMVSDDITAREETSYELRKRKDTDTEDIEHMRKIYVDMINDDRVKDEDILATSFKKKIYL